MVDMWIWTSGGFLSAVEHRDDSSKLMVRARDRESLEVMVDGAELAGKAAGVDEKLEIIQKLPSDYPWRVEISKATFALYLQYEVMNYLNYHNFKNALTETRGQKWHDAAMSVWTDMLAVTDSKDNLYGAGNDSRYGLHGSYANLWANFETTPEEDAMDDRIAAAYEELDNWSYHVEGSEDEVEFRSDVDGSRIIVNGELMDEPIKEN